MKHLGIKIPLAGLAFLTLATDFVFGVVPLSSVQRTTSTNNIVPGKFIIEVSDASQVPTKRSVSWHVVLDHDWD